MLYAARAASLAANAHVLAAYAGALWPPLDGPLTIIVTIAAITLVNIIGIRRAVDTLGGMTMLIKLMPLILIGALGLLLAPIPSPTLPEFSAVEGVALAALYAFVGFEAATIPAGETRDPQRNIPRALLPRRQRRHPALCRRPARLFGIGHRRKRRAAGRSRLPVARPDRSSLASPRSSRSSPIS